MPLSRSDCHITLEFKWSTQFPGSVLFRKRPLSLANRKRSQQEADQKDRSTQIPRSAPSGDEQMNSEHPGNHVRDIPLLLPRSQAKADSPDRQIDAIKQREPDQNEDHLTMPSGNRISPVEARPPQQNGQMPFDRENQCRKYDRSDENRLIPGVETPRVHTKNIGQRHEQENRCEP